MNFHHLTCNIAAKNGWVIFQEDAETLDNYISWIQDYFFRSNDEFVG
jgi:hypothetical protein